MENTNKTKTIAVVAVAAIIIAYFLFRKKDTKVTPPPTPELPPPPPPPQPPVELPIFVPPYQLPNGIYNGQRCVGTDGTQYIIKDNMKYGLTWEQWVARNWDAYEIVNGEDLNSVPNGGLWQGGLVTGII